MNGSFTIVGLADDIQHSRQLVHIAKLASVGQRSRQLGKRSREPYQYARVDFK